MQIRAKKFVVLIASVIMAGPVFSQGAASATQQGNKMQQGGAHGGMSHDSSQAKKMPFDHQFLDTMSMHHSHGIQMAKLGQERAAHDELKQMAGKMRDEQQDDIKKMQAMKEKWYGGKGDAVNMQMPGMKESMQSHDKNMEKLKSAKGERFDTMFLEMMSKHHTDGTKMASEALKRAEHQEVKDMAKKIADSQQKEKADMAKKRKEWKVAGKSS